MFSWIDLSAVRIKPNEIPIGYFFILWLADSGAYPGGRFMGKHPLFKRISPGKTWEGSTIDAVVPVSAAYADSRLFTVLSLRLWIIMALIVIVAGSYGDLVKSMFKRSAGLKDSGHILTGHGGVLDRFDSLLGSAPPGVRHHMVIPVKKSPAELPVTDAIQLVYHQTFLK